MWKYIFALNPALDAPTPLIEVTTNHEYFRWSIEFLGCIFISKLHR